MILTPQIGGRMKLVRAMKKYGHIQVANAMGAIGYAWKNPRHRPTNIERMVQGLPRCVLKQIIDRLRTTERG